jgi:rubrerythrin
MIDQVQKEPIPVLDIDLKRKWVCGECGQIYNDRESAYVCCRLKGNT